jgi:hypothetical protein
MTNQDIASRIRESLENDGRVTCATLHEIARELNVEPVEVGNAATALDIRACRCQLGLFGYGPKEEGKGRVVEPGMDVSEELEARMRRGLVGGRLPCITTWESASEFNLKRRDLGNAAETLGISISPCQLGFF